MGSKQKVRLGCGQSRASRQRQDGRLFARARPPAEFAAAGAFVLGQCQDQSFLLTSCMVRVLAGPTSLTLPTRQGAQCTPITTTMTSVQETKHFSPPPHPATEPVPRTVRPHGAEARTVGCLRRSHSFAWPKSHLRVAMLAVASRRSHPLRQVHGSAHGPPTIANGPSG